MVIDFLDTRLYSLGCLDYHSVGSKNYIVVRHFRSYGPIRPPHKLHYYYEVPTLDEQFLNHSVVQCYLIFLFF